MNSPTTGRRTRSVNNNTNNNLAVADAASWYCATILLGLILMASIMESSSESDDSSSSSSVTVKGNQLLGDRPCDEIYVVREGETLNTISEKCGDPYIVEENPHIHDPDDVFPGLVIKITSSGKFSR
ncbi:hypothetical protein LINGRAHAP2_LOCUS22102 [Linum grandiflorum]